MFNKLENNFQVMDFASLYPTIMKDYSIDESLVAKIRSYERRRIIDEVLADLEAENKNIDTCIKS